MPGGGLTPQAEKKNSKKERWAEKKGKKEMLKVKDVRREGD